jgi:hypothetical protein
MWLSHHLLRSWRETNFNNCMVPMKIDGKLGSLLVDKRESYLDIVDKNVVFDTSERSSLFHYALSPFVGRLL